MKSTLLFVGTRFRLNQMLSDYVLRHLNTNSIIAQNIIYFDSNDKNLILELERLLELNLNLLIATDEQSFSLIGKMLCTLTGDNQILFDEMLLPSKTSVYEQNSYLLEHNRSRINVILTQTLSELPPILLNHNSSRIQLHIFQEEKPLILLNPLAKTFEIDMNLIEVVDGWLLLEAQSRKFGNLTKFIEKSSVLLSGKIIASTSPVTYIIEKLAHNNKTVSFAESCTGGLLASFLTSQSGSSAVFNGSLVTYSDELKSEWLGIDEEIIKKNGAVSEQTVEKMLLGALAVSKADYSLAISGIAGPTGGSEEKPVGTVIIGASTRKKSIVKNCFFAGDRKYIQEQSAYTALKMLLEIDSELFFSKYSENTLDN